MYTLSVLRIRDVYPGSRILILIHPGSNNSNKRGEEKNCSTFFCSHKDGKLKKIILFLNRYRKKFEPIHKKL
jgi:hypothetical protein